MQDADSPGQESATSGAPAREARTDLRVVGIGASAGGLESLETLFGGLPPDPGMAFVVIQHLSPDFRSMMTELLSRHSSMPVVLATNGIEVVADHVYLLPRRKEMTIEKGRLVLTERDPTSALTLPIDVFFRSLAADLGANATAIVLSGSGSDGSRGVCDVKRAGGTVLVQSPESAKFEGMPRSTIATGVSDFVGTPRELASWLVRPDHEHAVEAAAPGAPALAIDTSPGDHITRLLLEQFGIDFGEYKSSTVGRRIARRVELTGRSDVADYAELVASDPVELNALYHDLLIGVTQFFRDPDAFDAIDRLVMPAILDQVPEAAEIRVWVPGCATGEEAYSLAILLHEHLTARDRAPTFKILATDVHRASLARGSAGVFSEEQLGHVTAARRGRYFTRQASGYQVSQDLRQQIVFAPHNVTRDAPFSKMHLVSCRNMLIYLEPEAQRHVLALLHLGLRPSGFLFLGPSETTSPYSREFDVIDEHWRIYRKRRDVRLLDPLSMPLSAKPGTSTSRRAGVTYPSPSNDTRLLAIYDKLLDRYMPAGLLVDGDHTLVDTFGGAERYLRVKPRRPSTNVLDLLSGDLRTLVGNALQRLEFADARVQHAGVRITDDDDAARVHLTAEVLDSPRIGRRHVLITLREDDAQPQRLASSPRPDASSSRSSAGTDSAGGAAERAADASARIAMLEEELAYTRETLQAATEQQQTSNEELQATNEELIASNEELQSTNEELHSVNEELYTVNAEHQKKILQLREVNNDIQNLLEGTDVGTLFLDQDATIRKFTPRIASVFHVRPNDVGRHIRHFAHDLARPQLFDEIERAINEGVVTEDEVHDRHGTTYFLRIQPYQPVRDDPALDDLVDRTAAAAPDADELNPRRGVMLTLTDISALDRARVRVKQLSAIVESSDDAIISNDLRGVITTWNRGAEQLYGFTTEEAIGNDIRILSPPEHRHQIDEFLELVRSGGHTEHVETVRVRKDGRALDVSVTISPILDGAGEVVGASDIARDISGLKQSQRTILEREARIRLLLESTAEAIYGIDRDGVCTFCNPTCARLLGYASADELIGARMHDLIHHSRADGSPYPVESCPIYQAFRNGQDSHVDDEVLFRADGSSFAAEYWSHPVRHNGVITGAVVTFLDITERRQADNQLREVATRQEQFLAMLSHELRNPLAAILGATSLISEASAVPEPVSSATGVISRQSRHMARLLDDLLDVSRITHGGVALRKRDLDLRDPLRAAIEAATPALRAREVDLVVELPDEPVPVRGDPDRLHQIAGNLLGNAAKYSPSGSRVELRLERGDDEACLSVADQGHGIPPELLPTIFELFVQGDQGRDRTEGGLGVGLALVRHMVDLHGGRVTAESAGIGRGSTFRVHLPMQPHAILSSDDDADDTSDGALRIVVVEDQLDARNMLKALLELKGHTVLEAADGERGLELVRRAHPDAALIDIGLPGLDGLAVARALREDRVYSDVLLVALTGYGTEDDVRAAVDAGFDQHLTKPTSTERIQSVLGQLGKHRAQRARQR